MTSATYSDRRDSLETYFDSTAVKAWAQLTSDAPVSGIRETVRQGRDQMRGIFLSWLPQDMRRRELLDAGCGTGALAVETARRGARVTAVDVAGNLIRIACERTPTDLACRIDFAVGDMLDPNLGRFHHVVAMDSLIHYPTTEIVAILAAMAERTSRSIIFTFAPRTPMLSLMHAAGRLFPKANRAPAIEPAMEAQLRSLIGKSPSLRNWTIARSARVSSGFYKSQALELVRS